VFWDVDCSDSRQVSEGNGYFRSWTFFFGIMTILSQQVKQEQRKAKLFSLAL
jgi:hypothetical protein